MNTEQSIMALHFFQSFGLVWFFTVFLVRGSNMTQIINAVLKEIVCMYILKENNRTAAAYDYL